MNKVCSALVVIVVWDDHPCDKQSIPNENGYNYPSSKADMEFNYWSEGKEEIPVGVTDTMLTSADFL